MTTTGTLLSINVSPDKGTEKRPVSRARLLATGLEGDAHAGDWHRQVSVLARECVDRFEREEGESFSDGDFAENLTVQGLDLEGLAPGERLRIGEAELEVTQIGKACHGAGCSVFHRVGRCVMPREGVFCRVLAPGTIEAGDEVRRQSPPSAAADG